MEHIRARKGTTDSDSCICYIITYLCIHAHKRMYIRRVGSLMHRYECVNVINGMQRFEYVMGVLPLQCYTITLGNNVHSQETRMDSYMRIHECDHKTHGVGANVITLVDPEAGGRGVSSTCTIAPKDFLIKIPQPTRCPYALCRLNDRFD